MNRVKILASVCAVLSAFALMTTGCSSNNNDAPAESSTSAVTTLSKGENAGVVPFYTKPTKCEFMRKPENCIYYSDTMTDSKSEVYYNAGVWTMYTDEKFTQLQQYCVTDVSKTLADAVKGIDGFNEETVTYLGYTDTNEIIELSSSMTFKDVSTAYIFIEWTSGDYYYSYTYQQGDVSVFSVFTDSLNLFREYSKAYMDYLTEQGQVTDNSGATTEVSVADDAVEGVEVATDATNTEEAVADNEQGTAVSEDSAAE